VRKRGVVPNDLRGPNGEDGIELLTLKPHKAELEQRKNVRPENHWVGAWGAARESKRRK